MFDPNDPLNNNLLNDNNSVDPYDPLMNGGVCPTCGMPLEFTAPQGIYCLECAMTIGTVYDEYEQGKVSEGYKKYVEEYAHRYKKMPEKIQPPQERPPEVKKEEETSDSMVIIYVLLGVIILIVAIMCLMYDL